MVIFIQYVDHNTGIRYGVNYMRRNGAWHRHQWELYDQTGRYHSMVRA